MTLTVSYTGQLAALMPHERAQFLVGGDHVLACVRLRVAGVLDTIDENVAFVDADLLECRVLHGGTSAAQQCNGKQ